jgi:hypothetical protein
MNPADFVAQTGSLPYRRLPTGDTADYQSALQKAARSWRASFRFCARIGTMNPSGRSDAPRSDLLICVSHVLIRGAMAGLWVASLAAWPRSEAMNPSVETKS